METTDTAKPTVDALKAFLRGEISAVESYDYVLEHIRRHECRSILEECRRSHDARARRLTQEIERRCTPASAGSGLWGSLAKWYEQSAMALGDDKAVAALESGERRGLLQYENSPKTLDAEAVRLIETELLPLQRITHGAMVALEKSFW